MTSRRDPPPLLPPLGVRGVALAAIRGWRVVLVACATMLAMGVLAWKSIPRREDPRVDLTELVVYVPYPGASAEDVETRVVRPLEESFHDLSDLTAIESTASANVAFFHLVFRDGTSMEPVFERVRGKVLAKRRDLPVEVQEPTIRQFTTANVVQMVVAVSGFRSDRVLHDGAARVKSELEGMRGISGVELRGDRKPALRVSLDSVRLEAHHLTTTSVVERIREALARTPAGNLHLGSLAANLRTREQATDAASLARVPVLASPSGLVGVTLADVADVREDYETSHVRFSDEERPAIGVEVRFQSNADAIALGNEVRERLGRLRRTLPPGVRLEVAYDQPRWIERTVSSFVASLAEGVLFVVLVIAAGMRVRAALVVATAVPLAIASAVFGLFALGFALDKISIAGLIVALGLLVDDAVVVTESIQLMRDRGIDAVRAAVAGTARVFWANNGTTAVACASFLPLVFMGGKVGTFIRGLPAAVMLALVASLVIAQFVTPWLAALVVRPRAGTREVRESEPLDLEEDSASVEEEETNPLLRRMKRLYARFIPLVIRRPFLTLAVGLVALGFACSLLPTVGVEFFPKSEKRMLFVKVALPRGTDLAVTSEKTARAMVLLRHDRAVARVSAMVGGGYSSILSGRTVHGQSSDYAEVLVTLGGRESPARVAARLRHALVVPGARTTVEEIYDGTAVAHPVMIRIHGDDTEKLRLHAERLRASLGAIPGTLNVSDNLADSQVIAEVEVSGERAAQTGLTPGRVGMGLRMLYGEDAIGEIQAADRTLDVVVDPPFAEDESIERLLETRFASRSGAAIPLRAVAGVTLRDGSAELKRRNGRSVVEVSCDVDGTVLASEVVRRVRPVLERMPFEPGFGYELGGAEEDTQQSFASLSIAALATLATIFLVLVLMLQSLGLSSAVLAAIPFVLVGAIPGLALTGNHFGFMAFLGVISLIGVYVNHKIYFVERVKTLIDRGVPWPDAIARAGVDRMRPVVLTALTAVLGLVPLTLGGGTFWAPFGWVNIFGLTASIPLSLVLLPALVTMVFRLREAVARRIERVGAAAVADETIFETSTAA